MFNHDPAGLYFATVAGRKPGDPGRQEERLTRELGRAGHHQKVPQDLLPRVTDKSS